MTTSEHRAKLLSAEALLAGERDFLKQAVRDALQEVLEAEMTEFLGGGAGRTHRWSQWRPGRLLRAQLGHPDRQARVAGTMGSQR